MNNRVFVNEFIELGLKSFFQKDSNNPLERHIVECLCDVYGTDCIKSIYDTHDEGSFTSTLFKYGLSRTNYDNFLRDTIKYEKFRKENAKDPALKSDIASKIEVHLIIMFLHKCLLIEPTLEEIGHFENNLLNNFEIIKLHFNTSINPNRTRDIWNKKKRMLEDNVELVEIKPDYLDEFTYAKFGTSLKDVKQMDYRMVEELNCYIKSKMQLDVTKEPEKSKLDLKSLKRNTVLSTGNGFVDALFIAAIMATEVSIGLIYLFLHMK